MKKILFLLLLCPVMSYAQSWQWGRQSITNPSPGLPQVNGDVIAHDMSGNIYISGIYSGRPAFGMDTMSYYDGSTSTGIYLVKYDSLGNLLWVRNSINGSGRVESIAVDSSGYIYITGYSNNPDLTFGTYTLSSTYPTFFIVKYSSTGEVLWLKHPLYSGISYSESTSMAVNTSGDIYIAGFFHSSIIIFGNDTLRSGTNPSIDMFVAKYDTGGNAL